LLLKIIFFILTYLYLYYEIFYKKNIDIILSGIREINYFNLYFVVVLLLMLINWGIEAYKWKYAVNELEKVTYNKALQTIFSSVAIGIFTPNRVGEIVGRVLFLKKSKIWEATFISTVNSIAQLLVTIITGLLALPFFILKIISKYNIHIYMILFSLIICAILLYLYYNIALLSKLSRWKWLQNKEKFIMQINVFKTFSRRKLSNLLLYSLLRYIVFGIQFILIMKVFSINMNLTESIIIIPIYFLFITIIPTFALSEIGVRCSVSIYIISLYGLTQGEWHINLLLATTLLWLINIFIPAIIGSFFYPLLSINRRK